MPARRPRRVALCAAALVVSAAACAARREAGERSAALPPPAATPLATPTAAPEPTPVPAASPAATAKQQGARRRNVVLIGDSTTYGTPPGQDKVRKPLQSAYNPGAVLETLLDTLEPQQPPDGTPWRGARVFNFGVGASTTEMWLSDPPSFCKTVFKRYAPVKAACDRQIAWVKGVVPAMGGRHVDAVIVDLGLNDLQITEDPKDTVDRLVRIRDALRPIPVLLYPPMSPPDGQRGDWADRVRAEMTARGLFTDREYPPYVPTFDGLHPTAGGYAAKGGLWLDGLRKLP
jgi:lysophospholipase L1-like esterase